MTLSGPILRMFEVKTKDGCTEKLLSNFATTSADVVKDKPGNLGYFFGRCIQGNENTVMFVSVWRDMEAIKSRFGAEWESSYIPDGYEDLIEECFLRHFDVSDGWHVEDLFD